ncbi:hypothetical protein [Methylobacterium sp. P1-11]|uniref:hypothetical protein n=1 Tax=Methylobacterium sp. P1-11 TaxID=2024616 RepID=UPI0015664C68|nr:hypothetical protein [Methylobacterium sp. P1-11]
MTLALLAALLAGALCLGMLSTFLPLRPRREDIELAPVLDDEFFDVSGPIIDLEPIR